MKTHVSYLIKWLTNNELKYIYKLVRLIHAVKIDSS